MPLLVFPFVVLTERHGEFTVPVASVTGYVAAFSSVEKAKAYMLASGRPDWQMRLVSRPTLPALIESLRMLGSKGFRIDPGEHGEAWQFDFDRLGPSNF